MGSQEAMDGFKLWEREPVGVPRITDRTDGRADRLKALGNAVCPSARCSLYLNSFQILKREDVRNIVSLEVSIYKQRKQGFS